MELAKLVLYDSLRALTYTKHFLHDSDAILVVPLAYLCFQSFLTSECYIALLHIAQVFTQASP